MKNIPTVRLNKISQFYAQRKVLSELSLELYPGKIHALLGQNGAGKTTTMKIIGGLLDPSEGERVVLKSTTMGYLGEIPPLFPEMRLKEYLQFCYGLYGKNSGEFQKSFDFLACSLQFKDLEQRLVKNLSFGNRQKLGLAQALIHDPDLIILDEPTIGLDPEMVVMVRNLLHQLKEKKVIILSSHLLEEVNKLADDLSVLHHGQILYQGSLKGFKSQMNGAQLVYRVGLKEALSPDQLKVLTDFKLIQKWEQDDEGLRIFTDQDFAAEELLEFLVKHRIIPCHFEVEKEDLERGFLSMIQNAMKKKGDSDA